MAQNRRSKSVIDSLGEEIVRIVTPVSICMFMVVVLVSILNTGSSSSASSFNSIATIAYNETTSDSFWEKFKGALFNSLIFVAAITLATFVLVLLFYLRCTHFLKLYMGFSSFLVLGFMGGEIALFFIGDFNIPIDSITFFVILFNFASVGVLVVCMANGYIATFIFNLPLQVLICGNSSRMPPENEKAILALHLAPLLETKFNPKKPNI